MEWPYQRTVLYHFPKEARWATPSSKAHPSSHSRRLAMHPWVCQMECSRTCSILTMMDGHLKSRCNRSMRDSEWCPIQVEPSLMITKRWTYRWWINSSSKIIRDPWLHSHMTTSTRVVDSSIMARKEVTRSRMGSHGLVEARVRRSNGYLSREAIARIAPWFLSWATFSTSGNKEANHKREVIHRILHHMHALWTRMQDNRMISIFEKHGLGWVLWRLI